MHEPNFIGKNLTGGIPAGITVDQLTADIEMLLKGEHTTAEELRLVCIAIENVTIALAELETLVGNHLPHKTRGSCNGLDILGKNSLLNMLFNIQSSAVSFTGGIDLVRKRVDKILKGKEQQLLF